MLRLILIALLAFAALAAPASGAITVSSPTVNEDGDLTFTVNVGVEELGAQVTTANGTASAGSDYTETTTMLGPGENPITVPVTDDTVAEPDETVLLRATGLQSEATGTGTIRDNDPRALSIRDATVNEGAGTVDVLLEASPATSGPTSATVPVTLAAGSAADGQDYGASQSGSVTVSGSAPGRITIPIVNDGVDEPDETFTVSIGAPTSGSATIADGQATVTIANDDLRALSVGDVRVTESDGQNAVARVPIALSSPTFRTVTVAFATIDGPARAPRDYLARFGTVTIPAGQTSAVVELAIVSDDRQERPEAFGLLIGRPDGATIGKGAGAITVADDDGPESDATPPRIGVTRLRLSGSRITARVSCPRSEQRCRGRITLFTRADRRSRVRSLRRERRIGRVSYSLTGGTARTVRVRVPVSIRSAARRARRLRIRAFAVTEDVNGNTDTKTTTATLRVRR
jgi:hypothetical protein